MILKEIETTTDTSFTFDALTEDASIKYRRIYFVFLDSKVAGVSALFALVPKFSNGGYTIATVKLFEIGGFLFTSIAAAMALQTGNRVTVTPTMGTAAPYSARVYASDLLN